MTSDIDKLNSSEKERIEKLHTILEQAKAEGQTILYNLTNPSEEQSTFAQKVSDKVAQFGGSWSFIIWFSSILTFWVVFNSLSSAQTAFDPFPFILMNLVLSAVAALQAPIIMMSQNRQEEKDRQHSEYDHKINLRAELEIRALHKKIDLLLEDELGILFTSQAKQLEVLKSIEERLEKLQK